MQKAIYKIKNKRGISTIEIMIGMLIFLVTLCFLTDLLMLLWKFSVVAQTTTQVARITGIQGGALASAPTDWPGGAGNYVNISGIHRIVEEKFETAGISSSEWTMKIGGGNVGKDGTRATGQIDYTDNFTVEAIVNYHWDMTSNILPLVNLNQIITARRPAMSEWKYNRNSWIGE